MKDLKLYGIIWNVNYCFLNETLEILNKYNTLSDLYLIDIADCEEEFLKEVYPDVLPYEYLVYKASFLKKNDCNHVLLFSITIPKAKFNYNPKEQHDYCVEAKKIKNTIRKKFKHLIKDYVEDIIIHLSDNADENEIILNGVKLYKNRIQEFKDTTLAKGDRDFDIY